MGQAVEVPIQKKKKKKVSCFQDCPDFLERHSQQHGIICGSNDFASSLTNARHIVNTFSVTDRQLFKL